MLKVTSKIINFLDQKNNVISAYRLFQRSDGKNLVFYPVPKNANSSFKKLFIEHLSIEKDYLFLDDDIPMHQKEKYKENFKNGNWLWSFLPPKPIFSLMPSNLDVIKLAIVRNPIERFLSAYNNRVLWHKDSDFNNLSVNEVITKLKNKKFDNLHFLPQTYFLGHQPDYYTHLSLMPSINGMVNFINNFFGKELYMKKLQIRHGTEPITIKEVSKYSNELRFIYKDDYQFIKSIKGNKI
tara:strand:+ start:3958 stop:4674 length:717 start_codon:yes stop_codon:yes gene_type:complete